VPIAEELDRGLSDLGLVGLQPAAFIERMNELLPPEQQMHLEDLELFVARGFTLEADGTVSLPKLLAWQCLQLRQRKPR